MQLGRDFGGQDPHCSGGREGSPFSGLISAVPPQQGRDNQWQTLVNYPSNTQPFCFQLRQGRVNWRMLHALDLDRVIRESDTETIEQHMQNITFAKIDVDDVQACSDNQLVKLIQTSQLSIEYLLHVYSHVSNLAINLRQRLANAMEQNDQYTSHVGELENMIAGLRKELRQKKKTILVYEMMARNFPDSALAFCGPEGTPGAASGGGTTMNVHVKCHVCGKRFLNSHFLELHTARRHSGTHVSKDPQTGEATDLRVAIQEGLETLKGTLQEEMAAVLKKQQEGGEDMRTTGEGEPKDSESEKEKVSSVMSKLASLEERLQAQAEETRAMMEKSNEENQKNITSRISDVLRELGSSGDKEGEKIAKLTDRLEALRAEVAAGQTPSGAAVGERDAEMNMQGLVRREEREAVHAHQQAQIEELQKSVKSLQQQLQREAGVNQVLRSQLTEKEKEEQPKLDGDPSPSPAPSFSPPRAETAEHPNQQAKFVDALSAAPQRPDRQERLQLAIHTLAFSGQRQFLKTTQGPVPHPQRPTDSATEQGLKLNPGVCRDIMVREAEQEAALAGPTGMGAGGSVLDGRAGSVVSGGGRPLSQSHRSMSVGGGGSRVGGKHERTHVRTSSRQSGGEPPIEAAAVHANPPEHGVEGGLSPEEMGAAGYATSYFDETGQLLRQTLTPTQRLQNAIQTVSVSGRKEALRIFQMTDTMPHPQRTTPAAVDSQLSLAPDTCRQLLLDQQQQQQQQQFYATGATSALGLGMLGRSDTLGPAGYQRTDFGAGSSRRPSVDGSVRAPAPAGSPSLPMPPPGGQQAAGVNGGPGPDNGGALTPSGAAPNEVQEVSPSRRLGQNFRNAFSSFGRVFRKGGKKGDSPANSPASGVGGDGERRRSFSQTPTGAQQGGGGALVDRTGGGEGSRRRSVSHEPGSVVRKPSLQGSLLPPPPEDNNAQQQQQQRIMYGEQQRYGVSLGPDGRPRFSPQTGPVSQHSLPPQQQQHQQPVTGGNPSGGDAPPGPGRSGSMNSQDGGGDGRRPVALSFAAARQGSGDVLQQPSADTGPSPFGKDFDRDMKPSLGLHPGGGGGSKEGNNRIPPFAASGTLNLTQEMDQLRAPPPFPPEEESRGPAVSSSQGQQQQVNSRPTISFETAGGDGRAGEGESSAEKGVGRGGFGSAPLGGNGSALEGIGISEEASPVSPPAVSPLTLGKSETDGGGRLAEDTMKLQTLSGTGGGHMKFD
uniref:C2H2-type domain-containing protein n=1 Tax=Chromera velia CCMP2878 TaxID=1169474 RepID=A0A0G4FT93_9ALVE|eukprot:Cvel_3690.t1-p1 / transcript=Cvel_3690.t1 / gene=Cvel_3690 / organism=Chromera_velia_CCMP2878 / gene_product=Zinc finger protein DZIP1L, putative / transcript_product=Zinc finger protein DZIP1L, putative / location=Cvel_scaffold153:71369-75622(-) / protein_length=1223 / sequence_SO=supercontig / SO=protein_coding / is_pseudo=false